MLLLTIISIIMSFIKTIRISDGPLGRVNLKREIQSIFLGKGFSCMYGKWVSRWTVTDLHQSVL